MPSFLEGVDAMSDRAFGVVLQVHVDRREDGQAGRLGEARREQLGKQVCHLGSDVERSDGPHPRRREAEGLARRRSARGGVEEAFLRHAREDPIAADEGGPGIAPRRKP